MRGRKGNGGPGTQAAGLYACGLLFLFSRFVLPGLLLTVRETSAGGAGALPGGVPGALSLAAALLAALESVRLGLAARARALSRGKRRVAPRLRDEKRIAMAALREDVFRVFASCRDGGASVGASFAALYDAAGGTELAQGAQAARERLMQGRTFMDAVEGTGLLSADAERLLRGGADHRRIAEALRAEREALLERAEQAGAAIVPWACWGLIAAALILLAASAGRM